METPSSNDEQRTEDPSLVRSPTMGSGDDASSSTDNKDDPGDSPLGRSSTTRSRDGASSSTDNKGCPKLRIISYNFGGFGGNENKKKLTREMLLNLLQNNEETTFLFQEHHEKTEDGFFKGLKGLDESTILRSAPSDCPTYLYFFSEAKDTANAVGGCMALFPEKSFASWEQEQKRAYLRDKELGRIECLQKNNEEQTEEETSKDTNQGPQTESPKFSVRMLKGKSDAKRQVFEITIPLTQKETTRKKLILYNVHISNSGDEATEAKTALKYTFKDFTPPDYFCMAGDFNYEFSDKPPREGSFLSEAPKKPMMSFWHNQKAKGCAPAYTCRPKEPRTIDHFMCGPNMKEANTKKGAFWWNGNGWEVVKLEDRDGEKQEKEGQEGESGHRPIFAEFVFDCLIQQRVTTVLGLPTEQEKRNQEDQEKEAENETGQRVARSPRSHQRQSMSHKVEWIVQRTFDQWQGDI